MFVAPFKMATTFYDMKFLIAKLNIPFFCHYCSLKNLW